MVFIVATAGIKPSHNNKKPVKTTTTTTTATQTTTKPTATASVTTVTTTQSTVSPTTVSTTTTTNIPVPTTTPAYITTTTKALTTPSSSAKKIFGYYAGWSAYSGYTPDKIDASKLDFINYAFANIGSDLKVAVGDTSIDPSNFTKLKALKTKYPNVKTLISVGGWTWSAKFSDVALTDASRTTFAASCVTFLKQYGFDGIDIDWEYPVGGGLSTNTYRTADKTNFTLLMAKIREKLNAQTALDGKQYYLTFAGGCGSWHANNMELQKLSALVDYGIIMTYDIHASWEEYTDFNAPLYAQSAASGNIKWGVNDGVNLWLSKGFSSQKLIMGVPFYGYAFSGVTNANNGLFQKFTAGKSVSYNTIKASYLGKGYTLYRHAETKAPWLWNGSTFVSYDDAASITAKAQYALSKSLGGAAVWEISQDTSGELMGALYQGLK
ncbi:MAG: hypothetical protein BGN88_15570 [Clostridiales bacterium 43-6]|nr:MAG: hypothetical protein BGN88_15570 [Clostridiales bacterium 43-6]